MSFSQRIGLKPARKAIQLNDMDQELRNSLWNALDRCYWRHFRSFASGFVRDSNLNNLFTAYWLHLFKVPIDTMPYGFSDALADVRKRFFAFHWNEVYDFVEFTLSAGPEEYTKSFHDVCNVILERENSGYRFVNDRITPITSEEEIQAIGEAIAGPFDGASKHLATALSLFSDRKNPDYRNSIKESISAVEAIAREITGDAKATLGKALVKLQITMHPALEKSLSNLYGYTSDEQGIRHAMLDEPKLGSTDAKFMLVVCSAFVNYMIGKTAEAGLKLK